MPEILRYCPLCHSSEHKVFADLYFREQKVTNQICMSCGLVFQSPRMTRSELDTFYAQEYRRVYQGSDGPTRKDLQIQSGRAKALLSFIVNRVPRVTRHLDIGCSAGILLKTINQHYQNLPIGIEPGDSYREYAVSQGLQIYTDLQNLRNAYPEPFDLVSMAHVLEHIPDPVAYLSELRERFLMPGGYLLIEVPNLYSHDSFETAHMTSFSEHALKQTLQKSGFYWVSSMKHGKPRSKLLPLYLTVLASPDSARMKWNIKPERGVKVKRKLGMLSRKIIQRILPRMAWIP